MSAYCHFFVVFNIKTVPIESANAASSWFATPNIAKLLKYHRYKLSNPANAYKAPVRNTPGIQLLDPNFGFIGFNISCSIYLATRVPVSTVVRINNASNIMAKWYQ